MKQRCTQKKGEKGLIQEVESKTHEDTLSTKNRESNETTQVDYKLFKYVLKYSANNSNVLEFLLNKKSE